MFQSRATACGVGRCALCREAEILAALDKLGDDLPPTMLGVGVPVIFGDMEKGLGELASSLRACPA
jgi:hypothetical protein